MQIETYIRAHVTVVYRDIEGVRTPEGYGRKRDIEWHIITARMDCDDPDEEGRIWITGKGNYVKKDGTVGLQPASLSYGSIAMFPEEWKVRIRADLKTLADRVTIAHDTEGATA